MGRSPWRRTSAQAVPIGRTATARQTTFVGREGILDSHLETRAKPLRPLKARTATLANTDAGWPLI
jgi:hypothetical protein